MIEIAGGKKMSFGTSEGPVACVKFSSIGKINEELNSTYATGIFKALNGKGIPSNRLVYFLFCLFVCFTYQWYFVYNYSNDLFTKFCRFFYFELLVRKLTFFLKLIILKFTKSTDF